MGAAAGNGGLARAELMLTSPSPHARPAPPRPALAWQGPSLFKPALGEGLPSPRPMGPADPTLPEGLRTTGHSLIHGEAHQAPAKALGPLLLQGLAPQERGGGLELAGEGQACLQGAVVRPQVCVPVPVACVERGTVGSEPPGPDASQLRARGAGGEFAQAGSTQAWKVGAEGKPSPGPRPPLPGKAPLQVQGVEVQAPRQAWLTGSEGFQEMDSVGAGGRVGGQEG